ncbi:MarR family winged helix-turn-helix transcriptional regulator [Niallia circulans]|uniref:MarR family winged helix-turn-helix transcriptional regulator n=1 Tax=Niallia circulans TaxID=1397 RepID=UPI00163A8C7E|nr:MarR family transcriptional regulator [Niallia circulans]
MREIDKLRYLIQCVQREGNNRFAHLLQAKGLDITPSQSEVITVLSEFGSMSIAELGELLLCNSQHPSRLVRRLLDKDYIIKENSKDDSRKVIISLTEKGKLLSKEVSQMEQLFNEEIASKIAASNINLQDLNSLFANQISETTSESKIANRFGSDN